VTNHTLQELTNQQQQLPEQLREVALQNETSDVVHWKRGLQRFTVKSYYKFVRNVPYIRSEIIIFGSYKHP
jgi:hypothetical protein